MLDTKTTFDDLVVTYAADPEQAERILANRFYRNISGALSGTQEYMAAEKLYELHEEADFDLVVVDTPPTRNALDFLDAPERLNRFLDHRLYRILMTPTRAYLKAVNVAAQAFLRTLSKVVGGDVLQDAIAFFQAFDGMEQGFRDRAKRVVELLTAPDTAYVLVASPRTDTVEEASFFAEKLAENDVAIAALVVNRMHPTFGTGTAADAGAQAEVHAGTAARRAVGQPGRLPPGGRARARRAGGPGRPGGTGAADHRAVPQLRRPRPRRPGGDRDAPVRRAGALIAARRARRRVLHGPSASRPPRSRPRSRPRPVLGASVSAAIVSSAAFWARRATVAAENPASRPRGLRRRCPGIPRGFRTFSALSRPRSRPRPRSGRVVQQSRPRTPAFTHPAPPDAGDAGRQRAGRSVPGSACPAERLR